MLAPLQDFQSELIRLAEDIDDRDLEDGAGQVMLDLFRSLDDRIEQKRIFSREELAAAMSLLLSPSEGECQLREDHLSVLLTALRLLWAGYFREILVEERHRWGEVRYHEEAARRYRERILKSPSR